MASFSPTAQIHSFPFNLTGTSATDVYTVGDQGEKGAWLIGVVVVDSTGSVGTTAKVVLHRGSTSWGLSPVDTGKPNDAENLEVICEPALRLKVGDEIRVTGASGHHVWTTLALIGLDTSTSAQSRGGSAAGSGAGS